VVVSQDMSIKSVLSFLVFAILGVWAYGCSSSVECKDHPGNGDRCDTSDKYMCRQTDNCSNTGCVDSCTCLDGHWSCNKSCIDGMSDLCGTAPMCWECRFPPAGIDASAPY